MGTYDRVSFTEHVPHGGWTKVRRSVYCGCGTRLFQGPLPKTDADRLKVAEALDELADALAAHIQKARA